MGGTLIRYNWGIRTTSWWMNVLALGARPVSSWNHDQLMRKGQEHARRLGAALASPDAQSRRCPAAKLS